MRRDARQRAAADAALDGGDHTLALELLNTASGILQL
jgi:hypothetical protein